MSRTRKDSDRFKDKSLEVVKRDDGTFDLFVNCKLDRNCVPEAWLAEELCVRYGFCGEEYDSFLREIHQNGRKKIMF
ncbi:MAG TPA: hypothetical protein VK738_20160 [Terriglobales bacterium]|jgi:hypothetical protein|nr:hypothetical protein [Terriglobales bacterium]